MKNLDCPPISLSLSLSLSLPLRDMAILSQSYWLVINSKSPPEDHSQVVSYCYMNLSSLHPQQSTLKLSTPDLGLRLKLAKTISVYNFLQAAGAMDMFCQPEGSVNNNLCIPKNYNKFDLPLPDSVNFIDVGIDITDVLRINDKVGSDIIYV